MSKTKKIAVLAIIAMVLTLLPVSLFAATADDTRLAGASRIETALEIASAGWSSADTVVLVPADQANLVDALAAAPLAGQENAPVLLTGKTSLDAGVKARIAALGATKVYVIGAISDSVVNDVKAISSSLTVEKLSGADRWATADAINAKVDSPAGTFIVGYNALPDALSVASYAAAKKYAIVLTKADGSVDSSKIVGSTTYLVGGSAVVQDYSGATRLGGTDRYGTNDAVVKGLTFEYGRVYVANGLSLVDALAASSLAAKYNAPILLSNATSVPAAASVSDKIGFVVALGGTSAVADSVVNSIVPTGPIEVKSVQGVSDKIYTADDSGQYLAFTINGGRVVTLEQLDANDYTIEFEATQPVFEDNEYVSTSGELDTAAMKDFLNGAASDDFKYSVSISQDNQVVAESTRVTATIAAGTATAASAITDVKFKLLGSDDPDDVIIKDLTSKTLVKDEIALISDVRANTVDGSKNVNIVDGVTVTSSDPFVLAVDDGGDNIELDALSTGSADITITSGSITKTVSFTVKSAARKLDSISIPVKSMKIAAGATYGFPVYMKDQYGDTLDTSNDDLYSIAATVSDSDLDEDIADVTTDPAAAGCDSTKGELLVLVTAKSGVDAVTGSGTVKIKKPSSNTTLGTIDIGTSSANAVTAAKYWKLEPATLPCTTNTIDQNPDSKDGVTTLLYNLNGYTASSSGYFCGQLATSVQANVVATDAAGLAGEGFVVSVSNPSTKDVLGVPTVLAGGIISVEAASDTVTGSATLIAEHYSATDSDLGRASSKSITVKNTAPVITDATFVSDISIGDAETRLTDIIKAKNIKVDGSAGEGKLIVAADPLDNSRAVIFFNKEGSDSDDVTFTAGDDIVVGYIVASRSSGTVGDITFEKTGDVSYLNVAGDDNDGKITIGIKKIGASSPFKTVKVDVSF